MTQAQVQQAVIQSGWQQLQQTLTARATQLGESALRLRDEWLVEQLLVQIAVLLAHLETNQPLPPEVRTTLVDLTTLATATGASTPPPLTIVPWLRRMEQLLFGSWAAVGAEQPPGDPPGVPPVTACTSPFTPTTP